MEQLEGARVFNDVEMCQVDRADFAIVFVFFFVCFKRIGFQRVRQISRTDREFTGRY